MARPFYGAVCSFVAVAVLPIDHVVRKGYPDCIGITSIWSIYFGAFYCQPSLGVLVMFALAQGLSIDVEISALLVLVPPVILVSLLPISFAGWGIREGAMIAMLGTVDVAPENALALSVAFGFLMLILSLPGALVWFLSDFRKSAANNSEKAEP